MKQYKVSSNRPCDGQRVENITCNYDVAVQLAKSAQDAGHTAIAIASTEEEEENTMNTTANTAERAQARAIINRKGGYRERALMNAPHTMERGTWTDEHKVVNVLSATPDPDGYRPGCAVDLVTRSIVG